MPGPRSSLTIISCVALALALLPAVAAAQPSAEVMKDVRVAVSFAITGATDRSPALLKLACTEQAPLILSCRGSWRDKRYAYAGRFFVADEGDVLDPAFAGIRTDRACAIKRTGAARRQCRSALAF